MIRGRSHKSTISTLHWLCRKWGEYNPDVLAALETLKVDSVYVKGKAKEIRVADLEAGMVALDIIRATDGSLLVAAGQEVTYATIVRLRNFVQGIGVVEPFRVRVVSRNN